MNTLQRIWQTLTTPFIDKRGIAINWTNFPEGFGGSTSSTWKFYENATEGYQQNPVVYACIELISNATAGIPIVLKENGEIIPEDQADPELKKVIRFLKRPNRYQSMPAFLKMWSIYMQLAGISFIRGANIGMRPYFTNEYYSGMMMKLIRPDQMQIVFDDWQELTGFRYVARPSEIFPPDEIMFTIYPDPINPYSGQSPIRAAAEVIMAHTNAIRWNSSLLKKGGIPMGILTLLGVRTITDEQREKYQNDFAKNYAGVKNAGSLMVVPGEASKYEKVSSTAVEMDWLSGKQDMMRDVCACFGVPSELLGDPAASTYNNVNEANKAFYQKKILSDDSQFCTELTEWLSPKLKWESRNIEVGFDTSGVECLNENETEKFNRANTAAWITTNEKRKMTGFEEIPGGDEILVPFSSMPLSDLDNPPEPTQPTEPATKALPDKVNTRTDPIAVIHPRSLYKTEEQRAQRYMQAERIRISEEKKWRRAGAGFFADQRDFVVADFKMCNYANPARLETREIPKDYVKNLFDRTGQEAEFINAFQPLQVSTVIRFGEAAIAELKAKGILFDISRPSIQQWIADDLAGRSQLINQTTALRIQELINAGVDQGWGAQKIADTIFDEYNNMSRFRSVAIARTEVIRADSIASMEAYGQGGTRFKEWLSARDDKVRDTHQPQPGGLDGQIVDLNADFVSPSGARGQGPGLMDEAGESINCRCTLVPLISEDEAI